MQTLDRITVDPALMNGQPCLRGMRLTVRRVLEIAALYPDAVERRKDYPDLQDDDVAQAIRYAALYLPDQTVSLNSGHAVAA
jgi:uncharacterized protein (DUF433 family)